MNDRSFRFSEESTQLKEYTFERRQRLQHVSYYDAWTFGLMGGFPDTLEQDGVRCTEGMEGITAEGFGDGIRVLCADDVSPEELVYLLRKLAYCIAGFPEALSPFRTEDDTHPYESTPLK